jgi:uncharacterized membrane protein (DUF485 family)
MKVQDKKGRMLYLIISFFNIKSMFGILIILGLFMAATVLHQMIFWGIIFGIIFAEITTHLCFLYVAKIAEKWK